MTVSRQVHDSELPTDFAILLAEKFGIYPPADPQLSHELIKRETDLKLFQQMSISGSFEEALLCYYDRDFNDDQLAALKLIYKASFHWLKGEVIGVLINKIKNPKAANKDFAESVRVLVEQLENKPSADGTFQSNGSNRVGTLAFKLAQIKD